MAQQNGGRGARKGAQPLSEGEAAKPRRTPAKRPAPAKPKPKTTARAVPKRSPATDARLLVALNRRYYDAFQSLDVEQIGRVWWHDEAASCIHPGWDIRHGWAAVRESYQEIFVATRSIRFSLGDVRVRVVGDLGYVTCVENLVTEEDDQHDYLGAVLATNVFERRRSEWRLIHHHTSTFATDELEIPTGPLH